MKIRKHSKQTIGLFRSQIRVQSFLVFSSHFFILYQFFLHVWLHWAQNSDIISKNALKNCLWFEMPEMVPKSLTIYQLYRLVISESLTESFTVRFKENSKFQKLNIFVLKMFHRIHEYSGIFVFYHMHNFIRVLYTFHPFQVFSTCFKMS